MKILGELWRRLRMRLQGERFDRDLEEEMALHLALRREEHAAQGLSLEDARAAAQRGFGNVTLLRETSAGVWGWRWLENFVQDLRHGSRALVRTPGFTVVAVAALALGTGANTAIFSVVNAVLLRPLGYKDSERLVTVLHDGRNPVAPANFLDWREQAQAFDGMAAAEYWTPNLTGREAPEHLTGLHVTRDLLPVLGIQPMLGRWLAPGDDRVAPEREVVLSHRLWQRRFQGDPKILGTPILLDGEAYTVVGIMPADFQFAPFWATRAELWAPMVFSARLQDRSGNSLRVFARLKPEISLEQARAGIATLAAALEAKYPGTNRRVVVTPLMENVVGKVEISLWILLGAVAFVLLIACANVAHMLLARTSDREKEIAVRTALGAGRGRVMAQFLTENLLLAASGSGLGLLLAWLGTRALVALSPASLPRVETIGMDWHVVLFVLAITVLITFVFGLVPAMQATTGNLAGGLKDGVRGASDGIERSRLRGFLVASEFALAFLLLIGAGLMIRSFLALGAMDAGFRPQNVLSMQVSVRGTAQAEPNRRAVFYRQLLEQVRTLPGTEAVGAINHLPLAGDLWGVGLRIEGRPEPLPGEAPTAVYRVVMPGYFETMRLPLRRGRVITAADDARASGVVVINERAAGQFWPGEDPLGKRIALEEKGDPAWLTVIGVAANARQADWAAQPAPEIYLPALQTPSFLGFGGLRTSSITLVVRTAGDPSAMAPAVKQAVWSLDRNLPISEVLTMERVVADATAQPRFEMLLLVIFAGVALLLAAVGIYGVMNYAVTRRTREIGIRMSLGATRGEVLRLVVGQGMRQAVTGSAVGIASALALARLMAGMLYGVRPTDPLTFGAVPVVLMATALAATAVPARKATRIEPLAALRHE